MKIFRAYLLPRFVLDLSTFYPILMFLGPLSAGLVLDTKLIIGFLANYLLLVFAFLLNDVADRDDDKRDEYIQIGVRDHLMLNMGMLTQEELVSKVGIGNQDRNKTYKRFSNPFGSSIRAKNSGIIFLLLLALISILLSYMAGGIPVLLVSISNLLVGTLYSSKALRLKALPIIDVLSHAYLLASVQILYFLSYPNATFTEVSVLILIGATLFSIGGDLSNEVRDYESDRKAGLHNTASILKKRNTKVIAMLCNSLGVGIVCLGICLHLS